MTSEITRHRLAKKGAVVLTIERSKTFLFIIALSIFSADTENLLIHAGTLLVIVPFIAVLGFLQWWRFEYWFEDGQFRVEQGIVFRKRTYIPLEKVQAVDVTVGVLQRLFGLVKLEIKTGAAGSQAALSAITKEEAERIGGMLKPGQAPGAAELVGRADRTQSEGTVYRLSPRALMLAGATSGRIGVVLGILAWLASLADDLIGAKLLEWAEAGSVEQLPQTNPLVVAALVVAVLFLSWVGAVVWEVITYGGFEAFRSGADVVIQRGLFARRQITLPVRRVQALRYHETLLRQPIGYGTLYVEAVGHAEEKGSATTLHPFIQRDECQRLIAELLPQFDVDIRYVFPPPRAKARFFIKPTLLVATPLAVGTLLWTPAALGFAVLPLVWLVSYVTWRDTGLSLGSEIAVIRGRKHLRRTTAVVKRRTTQVVRTTASLMQRRRDLATVSLTVATGAVGRTFAARDLDREDAWRALNWVVESDATTPWEGGIRRRETPPTSSGGAPAEGPNRGR